MARLIALILAVCVPTIMLASAAVADGAPSQWAEEMPGAEGTFAFKPTDWIEGKDTWWQDTDGVDPGTAGCHLGTDSVNGGVKLVQRAA